MINIFKPGVIERVSYALLKCEGDEYNRQEPFEISNTGSQEHRDAIDEAYLITGEQLGAFRLVDDKIHFLEKWRKKCADTTPSTMARSVLETLLRHKDSPLLISHLSLGKDYVTRNPEVASINIYECLENADLFESSESCFLWWSQWVKDKTPLEMAEYNAEGKREIGLIGEKATIWHEKFAKSAEEIYHHGGSEGEMDIGYDVSAVFSPGSSRKCIEVKTSERHFNEAKFTVSRNQWDTAMNGDGLYGNEHFFYFWLLDKAKGVVKLMGTESASSMKLKGELLETGSVTWGSIVLEAKEIFDEGCEIYEVSLDDLNKADLRSLLNG